MKKLLIFFILVVNIFANCKGELFSLNIGEEGLPLKTVLADVATKCNLTIVAKDDIARKKLDNKLSLVNIKKEPLKDFLRDLLATQNCFVKILNNKVYITYYQTKTYKLDIVSSTRSGSSSLSSNGDNNDNSNFSGSTSLNDTYQFDIWDVIKDKIRTILQNNNEDNQKILDPIVDKNSGLIMVTGNRKQIQEVDKYMRMMKKRLMKQVYIDVKILSVTLSKTHQTGINWQDLSLKLNGGGRLTASNLAGNNAIFKQTNFNMNALLNVLATYGNVNSISNPQIVTLNNQKAVIQVGSNVYYKEVSKITKDQNGNVFTEYTVNSKFVGVSLDIIPRIGDNNEITLYVYPTISQFVTPPQANQNRELPPDTKTNTLVSMVRLKNNQTLVLGGLIANDKSLQQNGVPILKEIPLIKYLFSYKETITNKKEIVFIITPHIIDLNKKVTLKDYGFGKDDDTKSLPTLEDLNVK